MDGVKGLPVPYGVTYLTFFILVGVFNLLVSWADGWLPVYTFSPIVFLFPLWFCFPLAIMTYLESVAVKALHDFRPLLKVSNETILQREYEFTTMPQKSVVLSSVFWGIVFVVSVPFTFTTFFVGLHVGMLGTVILVVEGLITYLTGSAIYYHTIRQLRLVNETVNMVQHFNLFRLEPVYAFSVVTSRTAIAWALLIALTQLIFPFQLAPIPTFALLVVQTLLAVLAFALPLRIVNQRLVAEKRKLLEEHQQRVESTLARLHRRIDEDAGGELPESNNAITALNAERDLLEKIPTWPWRARLFTGFLSVMVLPIVVFIIQLVIQRLLAP